MNLNYSVFFEIELLHEYYANNKCCDFEIVPDADTVLIAKNLGLQWRLVDNRLTALIKANEQGEPFVNRTSMKMIRRFFGTRNLRFLLQLKNPAFTSFTNIALSSTAEKKIIYFSNYAANKRLDKLFLSEPIDECRLNKTYLPGEFIYHASSNAVLEAVKKHELKKKTQVADKSLWKEKGGSQYPAEKDLLELTGSRYNLRLSSAVKQTDLKVFGYDAKTLSFEKSVLASEMEITSSFSLDLSSLQTGKYRLVANKESRMIYYDPAINSSKNFGIIDIALDLPGQADYALLDDEEKLKAPRFTIQFANRQVLWKYVRKDARAEAITDTGDTGYTFELAGDAFVSTAPIPLSETVCKTLKLDFNTTDYRLFPLPNPRAGNLGIFRRDEFDYLCSAVYLNY